MWPVWCDNRNKLGVFKSLVNGKFISWPLRQCTLLAFTVRRLSVRLVLSCLATLFLSYYHPETVGVSKVSFLFLLTSGEPFKAFYFFITLPSESLFHASKLKPFFSLAWSFSRGKTLFIFASLEKVLHCGNRKPSVTARFFLKV